MKYAIEERESGSVEKVRKRKKRAHMRVRERERERETERTYIFYNERTCASLIQCRLPSSPVFGDRPSIVGAACNIEPFHDEISRPALTRQERWDGVLVANMSCRRQ